MTEATKKEEQSDFQEHLNAAFEAWRESCKALVPDGFIEKGKEAQREALLALRSILDVAIEKLEEEGQPASKKSKQKIKVEDKD
jgi:hypothetical protein